MHPAKDIYRVDKRLFVELGRSMRRIDGRNEGHESRRNQMDLMDEDASDRRQEAEIKLISTDLSDPDRCNGTEDSERPNELRSLHFTWNSWLTTTRSHTVACDPAYSRDREVR